MCEFKNAWIYSIVTGILLAIVPIFDSVFDPSPETLSSALVELPAATVIFLGVCACFFSSCATYTIIFNEYKNVTTPSFRTYAIRTFSALIVGIIIATLSIIYFGVSSSFCVFMLFIGSYHVVPIPFVLLCMIIIAYYKRKKQA